MDNSSGTEPTLRPRQNSKCRVLTVSPCSHMGVDTHSVNRRGMEKWLFWSIRTLQSTMFVRRWTIRLPMDPLQTACWIVMNPT
jgi:hypothetical protein